MSAQWGRGAATCADVTDPPVMITRGAGGNKMCAMLRQAKLARLTKLVRLLRASALFTKLKSAQQWLADVLKISIADGALRLTKLFVIMLVACHWVGCLNWTLCRLMGFPEVRNDGA